MDRRDFLATRGAGHTILLALHVNGPSTATDLVQFSYLDQRTVEKGLALLDDLKLIENDGERWTLSAALAHDENTRAANDTRAACVSSSSSDLLNPSGKTDEEEEHAHRAPRKTNVYERQRVFQMLLDAGVGRNSPAIRELVELPAPYVLAHVEFAKRNGDPVGYLINRLRCGDPAPVAPRSRLDELVAEGVVLR